MLISRPNLDCSNSLVALETGQEFAVLENMNFFLGQPWWRSGLVPPSAQGVILETRDQVPRRAPCMEPASPSACVSASLSLSLSVSLMNQ